MDIPKAIEAITSWPPSERQKNAAIELLQHLSENPHGPVSTSSEGQCAIVVDSAVECLLEIFHAWLPLESWTKTTLRLCEHLSDVVELLQESPASLLVIHSNLFVFPGAEAISALVAVSPGTRYLVMTSWPGFIDEFSSLSRRLHVPIDTLQPPFSREEFVVALRAAETGLKRI
jgi:hypothetical protein